ncbi:Fc.00g067720.m01.CDS01 [Cosmosporella sp. VM-42]
MPRFGVAFNRRKSTATAEDFNNGQITPEQSSFRVIERTDPALGKSFDGGARMARASGGAIPKHSHLELEENMFSDLKGDLKGNRGSGASNTTKATSTDASSRHSNASTAPSSADFVQDEWKHGAKKNLHDVPARAGIKSSGSGFLNRAGRTFSFGQKKHGNSSPTKDYDVPPIPTIQHEEYNGRARGLTESTTSTATPPKLEESGGLDLGGDFGSMFSTFDKRASMQTLKNDGTVAPRSLTNTRPVQPAPLTIDKSSRIDPPLESWHSRNSGDNLLGSSSPGSPDHDVPPPVPRHQSSFKTKSRPSDIIEDEDAKLLQDSIAVGRLLSDSNSNNYSAPRFQRDEDTFSSTFARKPLNSSFKKGDDNLFEGSLVHSSRIANRYASQAPSPPRNKVMTPAQFERYRLDKERQGTTEETRKSNSNDDDEDDINYDDDEDEIEKSKQQAKQRRKQEAHMAVYRQQMMKVTGEQPDMNPPERPGLPLSMSAPQLSQIKSPSPGPVGDEDADEDDEVPLAILQAHGFPNKNRPPTVLSNMGSNSNLRAAAMSQARPGSVMGDNASNNPNQRHSVLPAFARNLPQDPFVGASLSRPAVRESLQFSGGLPASQSQQSLAPPQQQQSLPHGGLVGVIASEERSRAMRRGSPNVDGQKLLPGMNGQPGGFDPISGIPPHMMYNHSNMSAAGSMQGMPNMQGMQGMGGMGGMPGMPQMPGQMPGMLTVGDQAQLQMTQQMSQFMQMQMQFMQMMATNQGSGAPQLQPPYGGLAATQSMNDLSSRHSMMGDPMMGEPMLEPPRRMDAGMRTMSMVQPSSASFIQQPGYAGSIRASGMGYAPSIAPSERSNIGLPGRYRPVSQAPSALMPDNHRRTNTMSGALSHRWDENKAKSTINVVSKAGEGSDDDDEEGWEAMKAKRDKKRTMWKSKKGFGSELSTMI